MTDITTDRLAPPLALTADERERARNKIAARPAIMESLIRAALGMADHGDETAKAILANVRGGTP